MNDLTRSPRSILRPEDVDEHWHLKFGTALRLIREGRLPATPFPGERFLLLRSEVAPLMEQLLQAEGAAGE
jgi:hypothetical protein